MAMATLQNTVLFPISVCCHGTNHLESCNNTQDKPLVLKVESLYWEKHNELLLESLRLSYKLYTLDD